MCALAVGFLQMWQMILLLEEETVMFPLAGSLGEMGKTWKLHVRKERGGEKIDQSGILRKSTS